VLRRLVAFGVDDSPLVEEAAVGAGGSRRGAGGGVEPAEVARAAAAALRNAADLDADPNNERASPVARASIAPNLEVEADPRAGNVPFSRGRR
jgi:hypothetical protein